MIAYNLLIFLHILTVVFMAVPLFNLVVVNERVLFGPAHLQVDLYFENIIRGGAIRCYVFQCTALVTGVLLVAQGGALSEIVSNWVLLLKLVLLLVLTGLLSIVHFSLQPSIDGLLGGLSGDAIPPEVASQLGPLRLKRKRLAAVCLFLVILLVLFGLQTSVRFHYGLTIAMGAVAALFAWRVYNSRIPFGWI